MIVSRDRDEGRTSLPTADPTAAARRVEYQRLSKRSWQRVVKAPDRYEGKGYQVWACITQFDSATGEASFRGQGSYRRLGEFDWFSDGDNAIFSGDERRLDPFVTDDVVSMKVIARGSFSYETTIGGETTVPLFEVVSIKRERGSCR